MQSESEDEYSDNDITQQDIQNFNWIRDTNDAIKKDIELENVTYLHSFDIIPLESGETMKLDFERFYNNVISFEIACINFGKISYNLNNTNNVFEWVERNSSTTQISKTYYITLPHGAYTENELCTTLQSKMNDSNEILSYGDSVYGGDNGNSSVFSVNINSITHKIDLSLTDNSSNSPTDSFMIPWNTGKYNYMMANHIYGFRKRDTQWTSSPYKSFSCVLGDDDNNVLRQLTSIDFEEADEGSLIVFTTNGIEYDHDFIQAVDGNIAITTNAISASPGSVDIKLYKNRSLKGDYPVSISPPLYFNIHTNQFDTIHNGLLARIPLLHDEYKSELHENKLPLRTFHPFNKIGHIHIRFSCTGYTYTNNEPEIDAYRLPFDFCGNHVSLTFQIVCLQRKSSKLKEYIIE